MPNIKWGYPLYTELSRDQFSRDKGLRTFLARGLGIQGTERILDVGCGIGILARVFAPLLGHGQVEGIDLDPTLIAFGMRKYRNPNIHLSQGDARSLTFPSESFDIVISMGLFENIEPKDTEVVLKEMLRVLKKSGRLAVVQLDILHYVSLPEEEQFGLFWKNLIAGMKGVGMDLELNHFLYVCHTWGIAPNKSTYEVKFAASINKTFLDRYLTVMKSEPISDEVIDESVEFNYQFVKDSWTRERLREVFKRTKSLTFQEQFLVTRIGSEFHKRLPIRLYTFEKGLLLRRE